MLHLCLVGNAILAVGGTPKLYDRKIITTYPAPMLGRKPKLILHLREMTKENLQTYIDVCFASHRCRSQCWHAPQLELPEAANAPPESGEYDTLGQFYKAIEQGESMTLGIFSSLPIWTGFTFLSSNLNLFNPATISSQFGPNSIFHPRFADAGGIVTVTDLSSALVALTTIVNQGEGNPRPFDGPSKDEKDHYDIFLGLQSRPDRWNTFHVIQNPTSAKYFDLDKKIYTVRLIRGSCRATFWYCIHRFRAQSMPLFATSCWPSRNSGPSVQRMLDRVSSVKISSRSWPAFSHLFQASLFSSQSPPHWMRSRDLVLAIMNLNRLHLRLSNCNKKYKRPLTRTEEMSALWRYYSLSSKEWMGWWILRLFSSLFLGQMIADDRRLGLFM